MKMNKIKNNDFFENIATIIEQARRYVGRTADLTMCITYFEVGRTIVEEEQGGKVRAEYGKGLLLELSKFLTSRFKQGFSENTLKNARKIYTVYAPSIRQTMPAEFENTQRGDFLDILEKNENCSKKQTMFAESYPFSLSWSHYLPTDSNIYASEYSLYLPDKALLQSKLAEWVEEFEVENETI